MRSASAIALVLLGVYGCEQTPDFVASSTSLAEAGAGGTAGNGGPAGCDTGIPRAWFLFSSRIDDCSYSLDDRELQTLLQEHIYSQPARDLTLAEAEDDANRDAACELASAILPEPLRPLRWRYAIVNMEQNRAVAVICPRHCIALRSWLTGHSDVAAQCF